MTRSGEVLSRGSPSRTRRRMPKAPDAASTVRSTSAFAVAETRSHIRNHYAANDHLLLEERSQLRLRDVVSRREAENRTARKADTREACSTPFARAASFNPSASLWPIDQRWSHTSLSRSSITVARAAARPCVSPPCVVDSRKTRSAVCLSPPSSIKSRRPVRAETAKPFPSALPNVARSGVTPKYVCAPRRSQRKPVIVSSNTSTVPCAAVSSRRRSRIPAAVERPSPPRG